MKYNDISIPVREYVTIDIESCKGGGIYDRIIEIAAVKVKDGCIMDTYQTLVNPGVVIEEKIVNLTGITNEMVCNAPTFKEIYEEFFEFIKGYVWIGHSILSDYKFLYNEIKFNNFKKNLLILYDIMSVDTFKISKKVPLTVENKSLASLCKFYGIKIKGAHRAINDAIATSELYERFIQEDFISFCDLFKPTKLEIRMKSKKNKPVTKRQIHHFEKLKMLHNRDFSEITGCNVCFEKLTESEAARIIDKIILLYGKCTSNDKGIRK